MSIQGRVTAMPTVTGRAGIGTLVPGPPGETGVGISSVVLNNDYTLTINFTDGTSTTTRSIRGATGPQGPTGSSGTDGVSPTVSITEVSGGHKVTIVDRDHPNGQEFIVLDANESILAPYQSTLIAARNYAIGDLFIYSDSNLYRVTAAINQNGQIIFSGNNANVVQTTFSELLSGVQTALPQVYLDYLDNATFQAPTIDSLSANWSKNKYEIGEEATITKITHKESNISNIRDTLTLKKDSTVVQSGITAVSSATEITLSSAIVVTKTSAGNAGLTLVGTNVKGNTFSKKTEKTFYIPKFSGVNSNQSINADQILALTRAEGLQTNFTLQDYGYIYWVTSGTITMVTSGPLEVPMEAPVIVQVTINGVAVNYKVYRTSSEIKPGSHSFIITQG